MQSEATRRRLVVLGNPCRVMITWWYRAHHGTFTNYIAFLSLSLRSLSHNLLGNAERAPTPTRLALGRAAARESTKSTIRFNTSLLPGSWRMR